MLQGRPMVGVWWIAFGLLLVGALAWLHRASQSRVPAPALTRPGLVRSNQARMDATLAPPQPQEVALLQRLASVVDEMRLAKGPADARLSLARLRDALNSTAPAVASAAIRGWLEKGEDAPTSLDLRLNADGTIQEAPSLRVLLLDYLTQLDPAAASAFAEKILSAMHSSDEWAVGLRAYARATPTAAGRAYLQRKVREMIQNETWRKNPSAGFLEAFDLIVYTRDQELTPELAKMVRQPENRALAHAAYLTLDRLVQAEPAGMLAQLQSHPELLEGREGTRADYFARADVADPEQKKILENYLLDPNRSAREAQQFAATYPNANYMVSYNLLTQAATPTGSELTARDRVALRVVREWLLDPRFARLKDQLETIQRRLEQFVKGPSRP